jgi:molybdopterin-guanine dinucleotide biosynthesis protein A
MKRHPDLCVVVQAGGQSTRMGQDKALVLFHGQPLVQRILHRLSPIASELVVTTNHLDDFTFLNVKLAGDIYPDYGALGGLHTALNAAKLPVVAVIACDMPFANLALLDAAYQMMVETGCDAVVPRSEQGLEPFHAIYRREKCLPLIEDAIQAEKRRVDAWYAQAKMQFIPYETVLKHDPSGRAFLNVNTPEELIEAESILED